MVHTKDKPGPQQGAGMEGEVAQDAEHADFEEVRPEGGLPNTSWVRGGQKACKGHILSGQDQMQDLHLQSLRSDSFARS